MLSRRNRLKVEIQSFGWQPGNNVASGMGGPELANQEVDRRHMSRERVPGRQSLKNDKLNLQCRLLVESQRCVGEEVGVKVVTCSRPGAWAEAQSKWSDGRIIKGPLGPAHTYLQDLNGFSGYDRSTTFLLYFSLVLCGASLLSLKKSYRINCVFPKLVC